MPRRDGALRALAGVGPYTARAVRSFAFGEDVAAVDTNAVRVLSRCVSGAPLTAAAATRLGDRLVPAGLSWEFNQTMFDLGATVCTGTRPGCARCPLRRQCAWRRDGATGPDPWRSGPTARRQSPFAGSDRQGRGRLLHALRAGGVERAALAGACGWPDDPARARRWSRRRWWPRGSRGGPVPPRRCSGSSDAAAIRRGALTYEASRNPMIRRLTTSGRSRWAKWPAPSTISSSEPSAMKSSGDPMDDSSMQPSSRPWM